VGREEETDILLRRWQRAQAGEGQVVLLSGEPGIGKSRLTAWLLDRIAGEPHTRLRYFCSPHHADSALYPVIGQLERAAGFQADDHATSRLDKLYRRTRAPASPDRREFMGLLGVLGDALAARSAPSIAAGFLLARNGVRGNRPQRIGVYRAPNITAAKIKATPHRPIISKGDTQALRCCAAANRHSRDAGNRRIVRKPHRLAAFLSPGVPSARPYAHSLSEM
jgi:hypothetical protein